MDTRKAEGEGRGEGRKQEGDKEARGRGEVGAYYNYITYLSLSDSMHSFFFLLFLDGGTNSMSNVSED